MSSRIVTRPVRWLILSALSLGCVPTIPEGVFRCLSPSECPTGWVCEARHTSAAPACYRAPLQDAATDGRGPTAPDSSDGWPLDGAPSDSDLEPAPYDAHDAQDAHDAGDSEAAPGPTCYRWKEWQPPGDEDFTEPASLGAQHYAVEQNTLVYPHTHFQYLCLASDPDGRRYPGKSVLGPACLYTKFATHAALTFTARSQYALLIAPAGCVDKAPHRGPPEPLPTSTLRIEGDAGSGPLIPCVAPYEGANAIGGDCKGTHIGYLDASESQCVFEWYGQVVAVPVAGGAVEVFVTH